MESRPGIGLALVRWPMPTEIPEHEVIERHRRVSSANRGDHAIRRLPYVGTAVTDTSVSSKGEPPDVRWIVNDEWDVGVIFFGPGVLVKYVSARARRWMADYFGRRLEPPIRLPETLARWIGGRSSNGHGGSTPATAWALTVDRGDRRLVVRWVADDGHGFLLFQEHRPAAPPASARPLPLTPREAEVLAWVAEGKSNADVATILDIASATVKKHLENIYAKLSVENRTAAAALVLTSTPPAPSPAGKPATPTDVSTSRAVRRIHDAHPAWRTEDTR